MCIPVLGIDIGTTGISAVILDIQSGRQLFAVTVPNDSAIPSANTWEKTQNPDRIYSIVIELLNQSLAAYPQIAAIGITGQMHGILYIDENAEACSPLYTWQDARAGCGDISVCDIIYAKTAYKISPGYGLATHLWNLQNAAVPKNARYLITVMDHIGMKLCGIRTPLMHSSNAASLGLFDAKQTAFDKASLNVLKIDTDLLPQVTAGPCVIGRYRDIPVSIAIGDNQASFIGSVTDPDTQALCNIGTGSQISVKSNDPITFTDLSLESRPLYLNQHLLCGSALCGGRAYAILENFFRSYLNACGIDAAKQYDVMNRLAGKALSESDLPFVQTTFCGTRSDASLHGSIQGLSEENFTPENLIAATLYGIAAELYEMYRNLPHQGIKSLILSGNAARNNAVLREICSKVFALPVYMPPHTEEAAHGASMFAARSALLADNFTALSHCIDYTKG